MLLNNFAKIGAGRYAWRIEANYKNEFELEVKKAKLRWKPFSIEDAYQASLEQTRYGLKG